MPEQRPLASNSAIHAAVAANVTNVLFTRVEVDARARQALPPKAKPFAGALATGLRNYTENATKSFLASPPFQKIWVAVNTRAHEQLVKILTGQGHYVQTAHGQVAIDLAPVLARIKQRLDARGVTVFDRVPRRPSSRTSCSSARSSSTTLRRMSAC